MSECLLVLSGGGENKNINIKCSRFRMARISYLIYGSNMDSLFQLRHGFTNYVNPFHNDRIHMYSQVIKTRELF